MRKATRRIRITLSHQDREEIRKLREQIESEKPEILAKGRAAKKAHDEAITGLREAFALLHSERKAQGLSLADLLERTGIGRSALSRLERNPEANPTITTLTKVAEALGKQIVIRLVDKPDNSCGQHPRASLRQKGDKSPRVSGR